MTSSLRIGTRGSRLALAQSRWVQDALQRIHPTLQCRLVTIKTSGDLFADRPLRSVGGKGLFVKEIDEALLAGDIDCAVHSMKDLPAALAPGLVIAAVPQREDPRDVSVTRSGIALEALPGGSRVGTSSLRRIAFLRRLRPDLEAVELRGNVDTRLRKLEQAEVDAIIVAAAGLRRLAISPGNEFALDPQTFVPAVGQGALAVECRPGEIEALLAPLQDDATAAAVAAERAFLATVGGSCHTPLGAHARVDRDRVEIQAVIASPDGSRAVFGAQSGCRSRAPEIGARLAADVLAKGGATILRELETTTA